MKVVRPLLVIGFLLLVVALSTAQTNIYIAQNAVGGNSGADCANAHSAAWFNTAANWGSGATQIGPGDTVHVCGTITGPAGGTILTFQGSGTAGNPITLEFEPGASLSAPYCGTFTNGQACLVMSTASTRRSYLIVDGGTPCGWTEAGGTGSACNGTIVITANGTTAGNKRDGAQIEAESCSHCEIRNLGLYNSYVQSGGDTGADPQYQNAIAFSGSSLSIHDNKIHDCGWCLFYNFEGGDNGISIYQNDVYNTAHPIIWIANPIGTPSANGFIYANHFHDYQNWDTSSCAYHVEGIHVTEGPTNSPYPVFNNLNIYNNYFGPNSGKCLYSQIFLAPDTNSQDSPALANNSAIFNNVFSFVAGQNAITVGGGNGNVVYNNTIIGSLSNTQQGFGLHWNNIDKNSGYTIAMKNNAIEDFYSLVNDYGDSGNEGSAVTLDYNAYGSCTSGNCFYGWCSGPSTCGTATWASWQSAVSPNEANSIAKLSAGRCCSADVGIDSGFKPVSGSFLIGAGENLTSVCSGQPNPGLGALCYDKAGTPRPTTGAWDIGAYQDPPSSSGPSAPNGLNAVVH